MMAVSQTSLSQTLISQIESLPPSQIQEVLNFIDFLKFKTVKTTHSAQAILSNADGITLTYDDKDILPDIAKYAGMIKVKSTPEIDKLLDFDPACIATDDT